jgi:hypothetical protein
MVLASIVRMAPAATRAALMLPPEEADPDGRRLGDAVQERAYGYGCPRVALFVPGVLAAFPSPPVHLPVGEEESPGPEQQSQR